MTAAVPDPSRRVDRRSGTASTLLGKPRPRVHDHDALPLARKRTNGYSARERDVSSAHPIEFQRAHGRSANPVRPSVHEPQAGLAEDAVPCLETIAKVNAHPSLLSTGAKLVISPELCLVCPELRALALQLLPDRDPDGAQLSGKPASDQTSHPPPEQQLRVELPRDSAPRTPKLAPQSEPVSPLQIVGSEGPSHFRASLPAAILAYLLHKAFSVVVQVATLVAVLATVLLAVHLIRL
jgi:hypothetical protein